MAESLKKQYETGIFRPAPGEKIGRKPEEVNERLRLERRGKENEDAPRYDLDTPQVENQKGKVIQLNEYAKNPERLENLKRNVINMREEQERLTKMMEENIKSGKVWRGDPKYDPKELIPAKIKALELDIEELKKKIDLKEKN